MTTQTVEEIISSMLKENTGVALCDSGGSNGRMWQHNQGKDFSHEPEISGEIEQASPGKFYFNWTISIYHYLINRLQLDDLCQEFNSKEVKDWNSEEFYGVSEEGEAWIKNNFFVEGSPINTYNGESNLSQVLQFQLLRSDINELYVLLQIHGGCDVRGGYTDAKLFKLQKYDDCFGYDPSVSVSIYEKDKEDAVSTFDIYYGYDFVNAEGRSIDLDEELKKINFSPETHKVEFYVDNNT